MRSRAARALALDLEATISDAATAIPRPGLYDGRDFRQANFERVVLFTTAESTSARDVLETLAESGEVPISILSHLEYIKWDGEFEDLRFIEGASPTEIILVDDERWIHSDQKGQWIRIHPF